MKPKRSSRLLLAVLLLFLVATVGCNLRGGETPPPERDNSSSSVDGALRGSKKIKVSYYGDDFHGKETASGAIFDSSKNTAAHRTLPFGTKVELRNPKSGKKTTVEINDRGPFHGNRELDVSAKAAQDLGIKKQGVEVLEMRVVK